MTLPQIISRNQTQRINKGIYGSVVTGLGSGSSTTAGFGLGNIASYSPPTGKKALVRGIFSLVALGSNTNMFVRYFDQSLGRLARIAVINSSTPNATFEVVLTDDDVLNFSADNSANDGSADCTIEVEELPA